MHDDAMEPLDSERDRQARRHTHKEVRKARLMVGGVAAVLLLGLGLYTWSVRSSLGDARSELSKLKDKNRSLSDALELHRASSQKLDSKLTTCKGTLASERKVAKKHDDHINVLEVQLSSCKSSVANLEGEKERAAAQLKDFKEVTAKFRTMIDAGSLAVVFRHGQMIVKLPAAILFPSGKAKFSKRGQKALKQVARIFRQMPHRRFIITGHTDSLPLGAKDKFADNWELSTARALAVTKALIANGVRPRNLTAAGRSWYDPIASNRSQVGRQRNRRIEIVLQPYVSRKLAKTIKGSKRKHKKRR